jgi:hypothetical protein
MKTINKMILFLSIIILIACEKSNEPIVNNSDKLIGYWINPVAIDTVWKYERANSLKDNDYGFAFKSGQLFVERKNAGWCGTPPISYTDFDGTWTKNDSVINITVGYWGGLADYQWKIILIDNNSLTIYRLKEEYHLEK